MELSTRFFMTTSACEEYGQMDGTNIYPNYTMKALSKNLVHLKKKRLEMVWQE